jgi:hypothetical protein
MRWEVIPKARCTQCWYKVFVNTIIERLVSIRGGDIMLLVTWGLLKKYSVSRHHPGLGKATKASLISRTRFEPGTAGISLVNTLLLKMWMKLNTVRCPLAASRRLVVGCMELVVSVNTTRLVNHISNASNKFHCTSLNVYTISFTSLHKFACDTPKSMKYWHENVSKFPL